MFKPIAIGHKIIRLKEADSTNDYALDYARKGVETHGTIVIAKNQLQGKGQRGNNWESEPGCNLTMSLIVYTPFIKVINQFYLSKISALALTDTMALCKLNATIKWPNDILIGTKKIAGILIENIISGSSLSYSIIGIGVNVNQTTFYTTNNATSLKNELQNNYSIQKLLDNFCHCFTVWFNRLSLSNFEAVNLAYLNNMYGFGISREYFFNGEKIKATITNVDTDGKLNLKTDNNSIISVDIKAIRFIL